MIKLPKISKQYFDSVYVNKTKNHIQYFKNKKDALEEKKYLETRIYKPYNQKEKIVIVKIKGGYSLRRYVTKKGVVRHSKCLNDQYYDKLY